MTSVQNPDCPVAFPPGAARGGASARGASEGTGVLDDLSGTTSRERRPRAWRRSGVRGWDPDEVAAHLLSCERQIVHGLERRTPWAGIDPETRISLYGHAAAVIARIAASAQRPDWRTPRDLERAQVAAYRHQAQDHWRAVNAQSRHGERHTVRFDEELHQVGEAPLDRLFEQPDLLSIARDLVAEIAEEELRDFWIVVFTEGISFTQAGVRLEMKKSEVIAATRNGRAIFESYLERRASGELCVERFRDIEAKRAGVASAFRIERAEAHLESCYSCAIIYDPGASALGRGLLGVAPTALVMRFMTRAGEAASTRLAESSAVSRAAAVAVTAAAAAGSGLGVKAVVERPAADRPAAIERRVPTRTSVAARPAAPPPDTIRAGTVLRPVVPAAAPPRAKARREPAASTKRKRAAAAAAVALARRKRSAAASAAARAPAPSSANSRVEENEFSPEVGAQQPSPQKVAPPVNPPASPAPAELEFGTP